MRYCKPSRFRVIIAFCDDYCSANWKASYSQKLTSTLQKMHSTIFELQDFKFHLWIIKKNLSRDQVCACWSTGSESFDLVTDPFQRKKVHIQCVFCPDYATRRLFYRKLNFATKNNPKTPFLFKFLSKRRIIEIDLSLFNFIQP